MVEGGRFKPDYIGHVVGSNPTACMMWENHPGENPSLVENKRTFLVLYTSELSVQVTIREHKNGLYTATADHPHHAVGISDWFHFTDVEKNRLIITEETMRELFTSLIKELWPGMVMDVSRKAFRRDMIAGFLIGEWRPSMSTTVANTVNKHMEEVLKHQKI